MVRIFPAKQDLAVAAADHAAESLRTLLCQQDTVGFLAATGASQIEFLDHLTAIRDIDWLRVELFHLDEYIGLGIERHASFARYIKERIVDRTGITLPSAGWDAPTARDVNRDKREYRRTTGRSRVRGHRRERPSAFNDPISKPKSRT